MEMTTRGRTVTEADVVWFAAQTGDWHAQHSDAQFARTSRFGERIAHGLLVLSYALGLLPIDSERVVVLRRIADATFKAPVRLGDTIHVHVAISELQPVDDRVGLVGFRWRVMNQSGATVIRAKVDVLWRREGDDGRRTDGRAIAPSVGFAASWDGIDTRCLPL